MKRRLAGTFDGGTGDGGLVGNGAMVAVGAGGNGGVKVGVESLARDAVVVPLGWRIMTELTTRITSATDAAPMRSRRRCCKCCTLTPVGTQ